jgi:hypothetical protein
MLWSDERIDDACPKCGWLEVQLADARKKSDAWREQALGLENANKRLRAQVPEPNLLHDTIEYLSWALDLIAMYDARLAQIDGPKLVYSDNHKRAVNQARALLDKLRRSRVPPGRAPPPA